MPTSHRSLHCYIGLALVAVGFCACSDATGSLQGGQQKPLPTDIGSSGTGSSGASSGSSGGSSGTAPPAATWTNLYALYFGNSATGGCGSTKVICHQAAGDSGATVALVNASGQMGPASGFVCGTTASSCYAGMMAATPPLVLASDAANPTMALLYRALFTGGVAGATSDNMPETQLYAFTPSDLALIAQWIKNGALNN
jgi:hypothetical protein